MTEYRRLAVIWSGVGGELDRAYAFSQCDAADKLRAMVLNRALCDGDSFRIVDCGATGDVPEQQESRR